MATKKTETAEQAAPAKTTVVCTGAHALLEPRLMVRFPCGVPVKVDEVTEWMKCQAEAGLLAIKEA